MTPERQCLLTNVSEGELVLGAGLATGGGAS